MLVVFSTGLLILLTVTITISDIRFHRVPNSSLFFLALTLLLNLNLAPPRPVALSLALVWVVGIAAKVGMGDIKLLTILITLQGEIALDPKLWILFTTIAGFSIVVHVVLKGSIRGEIALAPAIIIPFTLLYLSF